MRGIFNVFKFTFIEQARKKSFIISTLIIYLLIIAAICIPSIIDIFSSKSVATSTDSPDTVYVIDSEKIISDNFSDFTAQLSGYKFILKQPSDKSSLMDDVKNNDDKSLIILNFKNNSPAFDFYCKSDGSGPDPDDISLAVKTTYGKSILSAGGVSNSLIDKAFANVSYTRNTLGRGTFSGMIGSFFVTILLFMAIYMYGYWVAMSIASEKTSRVMEILITSTKPSRIVIGKSLGMGVLGLCQLLGLVIVGVVSYRLAYPENFELDGISLNLSNFSPFVIALIIIYFVFGFAFYSMIYAVCGATISKAEDIQQALTPATTLSGLSYAFAYMTMFSSDSKAAVAASLIPFSSPFAMPARALSASIPSWQLILSLLFLILTTVLMCGLSIKLYSSAVLHYGSRLKISELIHLSKAK
jgi:ABC-2 type transport system permease protein